jgi:YggT family protein
LPRRQVWVWIVVVIVSLLLAASRADFHLLSAAWLAGFIYYLCRILTIIIFLRAIISWFMLSRYNLFVALLDDVAEPVLSPLRRVIPRLGMLDITPLVAIVILYFISFIVMRFLG